MIEAPGTSVRPSGKLPCLAFKKENVEQISPSPPNTQSGSGLGTQNGLPLQGPSLPPSNGGLGSLVVSESEVTNDDEESSVTAAHGSETSNSPALDSGIDMEEPKEDSVPKPPKREPPPPPPRPGELPSWVKSAARQQDAAEVMDNMTHLLQCAALPENIKSGDQPNNQVRRSVNLNGSIIHIG